MRSSAEMSPPLSLRTRDGAVALPRHATNKRAAALLPSRRINRERSLRGEGDVDGAAWIDDDEICAQEVAIGAGGDAGRDGGIERARTAVDRDKALRAARECDRVRAIVPPVIDVGPSDNVAKAHHVADRWITMLAYPLTGRRGLETGCTRDVLRPAIGVRWGTRRIAARAIEHIARENRRVAVGLGEHPDVGDPEDVAVAI